MFYSILIGIAVAIAVGIKLTRGNKAGQPQTAKPLTEAQLLRKLLIRARGDQAVANRLIAFEQQRQPTATRGDWIIAALERWERDSR